MRAILARLSLGALLLGAGGSALALTCTAIATGSWTTSANWSNCGGNAPGKNDTAVIPSPYNITVNNSVTVGAVTVNAGGTLTVGAFSFTVNGATSVAGTLSYSNAGALPNYIGPVTINAGGVWDNATGANVTFRGGLTHNGASFTTSANGLTTFATNNQALAGASPVNFARLLISGNVTVTNNNASAVSVTGALDGTSNNSTFANGANATLDYGNAAIPMATKGILRANATGNTVIYSGAAQLVDTPSASTYYNLTLSGNGAKTLPGALTIDGNFSMSGTASTTAAGTLTLNGNFSLGTGTTFSAGTYSHTLKGNFSNAGTFNAGTSLFTFNGTAAQALNGATTFNRLALSNSAANVVLGSDVTVNGTLYLYSGRLVTGTNRVILSTTGTIGAENAGGYVVGILQKNYIAGASMDFYPAGNDFPIGDMTNFVPIDFTGGTTATAGSLVVTTTAGDHPQVTNPIPSTNIDAAKSINRYWTLVNSGLTVGTTISATFAYLDWEQDPGLTTANVIAGRYDGIQWDNTIQVIGQPHDVKITGITTLLAEGSNDFAVGEPLAGGVPGLGRFNAFETSTLPGSVFGRIYTKLVGVPFSLDIVTVNNRGTGYGGASSPVTVELLDASPGGAPGVDGCNPAWVVTQAITTTLSIPSGGRVSLGGITVPRAYRDARLRMSGGGRTACSQDKFSVRPQSFAVTSAGVNLSATNNGTGGTPVFKTGANFNLTVVSVAGYDGTPAFDNSKVVGSPAAGVIGGTFGAAPVATGTASGDAFFYSEAGNFGLNQYAVSDSGFTVADQPADCNADFSNALDGSGKYGCWFGSTAVPLSVGVSGFGRFIPDNFLVNINAPQFDTACASGAFSYVGQWLSYGVAPVVTVTARNGTNNGLGNATTTNYAGAYMKLSNALGTSLNQAPYDSQAGRYSRFDALGGGTTPALDTSGLPATTADPVIGTFSAGAGTLSFGSGIGLSFVRGTAIPNAPFDADIALTLNVVDADGVAASGNPVSFGTAAAGGGIAFSAGKDSRFGRLVLGSAHGSAKLGLAVPVEAQYWSGQVWRRNTPDSCTSISASTIAMGNYKGSLNSTNMPAGNLSAPGALAAGYGTLSLAKPTDGATGSVDLSINLGAVAAAPNCTSIMGWVPAAPSVSGANMDYLQDRWCRAGGHADDPFARATFGIYRDKFIYRRENF